MQSMVRARAIVSGRVQGVGFRHFVRRQARALGLSGSVANRADGTVEAIVEGERSAVLVLLDGLRAGPPAASVRHVEVTWLDAPGGQVGFEVDDHE